MSQPTAQPAPRERLVFLDLLKGIAIILVVVGHVLGGLVARPDAPAAFRTVYDFIYAFHMPAFMWAAGFLTAGSLTSRTTSQFVKNRVAALLYPYLLWSVVIWACHGLFSAHTNTPFRPESVLKLLYNPLAGLWFLYVLFVWSVLYAVIGGSRIALLVLATAACVVNIVYRDQLDPESVQPFLRHALYFALGVASGTTTVNLLRGRAGILLFSTTLAGFLTVGLLLPYQEGQDTPLYVAGALTGTLALLTLCLLLEKVYRPEGVLNGLVLCGRFSLEIYVLHGLTSVFARILLTKLLRVNDPLAIAVICSTVGVLVPLGIAWLARRYRLDFLFRWRTR